MTPKLNPALRDFWRAAKRIRALYGGRSSSKSWDAAGMAIIIAQACKVRVLCTRQFQNKIAESVYTLLKIRIEEFGLTDDFEILRDRITHRYTGSEFIFYGMWRNFEEIKSLEGIDICWIEEARFLTKEQWRDLEPTIRKEGSQIWLVFNPGFVSDYSWRRFVLKPPPNSIVRRINHDENPFLSDTMRDVIKAAYEEDATEAGHVYGGEPRTDDEAVIIKRSWVMSAIDAHIELGLSTSGSVRIGNDVADDGADKNATVEARGVVAVHIDQWQGEKDDLLGSCSRVYAHARRVGAHIHYDGIGVGASCGSKFKELNEESGARVAYSAFIAGGAVLDPDDEWEHDVTNRDFFLNLKAQTWGGVARRLLNTHNAVQHGQTFEEHELIAIDANCDHLELLIDELSTPRKKYDEAGKLKVESKADLAKRGIPSHNVADAFIQAYSPAVGSVIDYSKLL